ncbi:putative uncharacterized protein DDB_G0291608 isoform X1 [Cotesia glomerata]|uniref:C2H2-type domain-containing protein n=1 Tax=Cotesia glomerata TaxID=32391 RepID=A0AAV7IFR2_COTGL|nr:putative uncharacterized protein DDB_G0291608 isoform X1 [Cotesia glomerata]KAH0549952.1 hypothetical protein KQX54_016159 [Cotesia glomerata]
MSEMTRVEQQQQQYGGSSNSEHHCKDCNLTFESDKSLEVHLRYHHENLLSQWAMQAQQEESNNNNSKAGNHNSHVKRESITAPADSSESSARPPSSNPTSAQHQQQQQQQQQQQTAQTATSSQQQPPPGVQSYNHFSTPMFSETSYFMHNEQPYMIPGHHYSPTHDDATNNTGSNYAARYHPYQHPHHYPGDRANSVSSTSPRSPLQCEKCGGVFEDTNQLAEHVRANHPASPSAYPGQQQYQQLGGSPQQSQQQPLHTSPSQNNQQPQPSSQTGFDYGRGGVSIKTEIKQEVEEQAEILDLDSHKVQTHRYEEELMRIHQHQEMQILQQQQHQQQQQQHPIQHPRNPPHSVSSMLGWPPGQPHEYHPGMSPLGPMDSVSPIPDQSTFMRGQHMPVEPSRHAGSPIITSTQPMPGHPLPGSLLQQPQKPLAANQSWKSNEARRPKTYNCTACNKWFTSSGHLKRHYNTTLHKNAVKQSNQPDPANMPISVHHHPGRDSNGNPTNRGSGGGGGSSRSPELSTSASPPNLMAGPSGEAARGLLHTPTNLYTTNHSSNSSTNSNSSDSSATVLPAQQPPQQQPQHQGSQQPTSTTAHMGPSMGGAGLSSPTQSSIPGHHHHHHHHHHHQQMGSPSPQLGQHHHLSIGSPPQMSVHHSMNSPMSPMQPPPPPHHLNSPSSMGSQHMNSPSPMMVGVPPMGSPPMGGTSMPHQPYPNDLPPHVTTTTSIPGLLDSINQQTIIGNEVTSQSNLHESQLPGFATINHPRPLQKQTFFQFNVVDYLVGPNQPQAINVGGLRPEDDVPQNRSFSSENAIYDPYNSPPRYESLMTIDHHQQQPNSDDILKHYHHVLHNPNSTAYQDHQQLVEANNNNLPHYEGKEEINPNVGKQTPSTRGRKKKVVAPVLETTKEHQVTSTDSNYISHDGLHMCIKCNKNFNKACYLTQHNKSFHSGEKPFKCSQCGKRFPLESLHAEHLRKHAGDKPYKCEICPKQFNHKTDLRRHMCLHTGEKPFVCINCGKGFIRKDHMMKHVQTHNKKSNNNKNIHLR